MSTEEKRDWYNWKHGWKCPDCGFVLPYDKPFQLAFKRVYHECKIVRIPVEP